METIKSHSICRISLWLIVNKKIPESLFSILNEWSSRDKSAFPYIPLLSEHLPEPITPRKGKGLRSILRKILIGAPVSNFTKLFYIEAEHFLMITVKWRSMNCIYNKETVDTS